MRILLIGGNGFIGPFVVGALVRSGHDIAVFHRGTKPSSLPSTIRHILGDRRCSAESAEALREFGPDVVIDLILSSGAQAREVMDILRGVAPRIVALSSMDVYRACGVLYGSEPGPLEPMPLTESSPLRTKLKPYPPAQLKMLQGLFGWLDDDYDKIPVEQAILSDRDFPGTVLRLPMVYGSGDPLHRFHPILKRIDHRRPVIAFDEQVARWRSPRGFVENVAAAIALAATSERAAGRVYNCRRNRQSLRAGMGATDCTRRRLGRRVCGPAERSRASASALAWQSRSGLGGGHRAHPRGTRVPRADCAGRSDPSHD